MSTTSNQQHDLTLRERIGGRWAISWQATVSGTGLVIVLATITGGGLGVSAPDISTVPIWFFAAWAGGCAVVAYIALGNVTIFRNRRRSPLPVWVVVAFHAGIGAVFAVVFLLTVRALGLEWSEPPLQTIIGFALAGLWYCMTVALVLDARDRYLTERERLIQEAVSLEVADVHQSAVVTRLREWGAASGSDVSTLQAAANNDNTVLPLDSWWGASTSVRQGTDRTLEGSFREAIEQHFPRPTTSDVIADVWKIGMLSFWGTGSVVAIAYYRAILGGLGILAGIVVVIGLAVATGAAVWAIDRLTSTGPMRLLLGIAVTALTGGATVAFFAPTMGAAGIGSVVVAVLLGSTIFVLLPASARTLRHTWRNTNARLNDIIARKMHSQVDNAQALANAASTIPFPAHLQPAVVACAAGLSQAARADGSTRLTSALQWSAAVLEDYEDPGRGANLASELTSTVAPWLGLVSISLDVSPAAGRFGAPVSTTGGILLQEGLAFACGQAAAAHVTVGVHDNDGRIEFHIHHDGQALREQDLPPDARWRSANDGLDLVTTLTY